jgi:hypothetical protein
MVNGKMVNFFAFFPSPCSLIRPFVPFAFAFAFALNLES